jgi:ABC-type multidrug transport system fused ATPase/permease subunit
LFGVVYEVIGFQHVADGLGGWQEYLLFNPWQGFVWLVTYNGHWSFVQRLFEQPSPHPGIVSQSVVRFRGETFQLYDAAQVRTDYVLGEFYWKVALGMKVNVKDFVCPPRILSLESYPQSAEQTWSLGEYIEPSVLDAAFELKEPLREPYGVYLNQPNPFAEKAQQLKWLAPAILAVLVLVQLVSAARAGDAKAAQTTGAYQAGTNAAVLSEPFEIKGTRQAIKYAVAAPVDNSWVELDIDLVNAETHRVEATREVVVEYYHGYDDGPWSEGKQQQEALAPGIPPGKYYLTIEASADPKLKAIPFSVTVFRDVIVWSNFWIALGLVLLYPLYCWARSYNFERARWLESDYTPSIYFTSSGDSD